ncbi:MAG: hypothetical protein GY756_01605 [bacterium]|nr:hypothetical protein [bacterium]
MYRKYVPKEFEVLLITIFIIILLILFIISSFGILALLAKSSISIDDTYLINSNLFLYYLSIVTCLDLVILFILFLRIFINKIISNCTDIYVSISCLIITSVFIVFFQPIYYLKISMLGWTIINVVGAALTIFKLFRIGAHNT